MSLWAPAAAGLAFGLQFNLATAVIGAAAAAAATTLRRGWGAWALGGLALAVAWAFGELGARTAVSASLSGQAGRVAGAVQMAVSALVGYLTPALVGAFVGRRVTKGFGWPAAVGTAITLALALSVIAGALADATFARLPAGALPS